jgi:hypothetical protein
MNSDILAFTIIYIRKTDAVTNIAKDTHIFNLLSELLSRTEVL